MQQDHSRWQPLQYHDRTITVTGLGVVAATYYAMAAGASGAV